MLGEIKEVKMGDECEVFIAEKWGIR